MPNIQSKIVGDINQAHFEKFCVKYKAKKFSELFNKTLRNYNALNLPPSAAELFQHYLRVQLIMSIWHNAHLKYPTCLSLNIQ